MPCLLLVLFLILTVSPPIDTAHLSTHSLCSPRPRLCPFSVSPLLLCSSCCFCHVMLCSATLIRLQSLEIKVPSLLLVIRGPPRLSLYIITLATPFYSCVHWLRLLTPANSCWDCRKAHPLAK
jgi:hypothetical protein